MVCPLYNPNGGDKLRYSIIVLGDKTVIGQELGKAKVEFFDARYSNLR
jgi:hypothetical protein